MKLLTVSAVVLIALVALAWVGYRLLLPRAFVAAGRGALGDARLVQLAGSRSARSAQDFNGAAVEAGPEHKFVLIDVRVDAPADKVDFDDFQLVREKAARLGEERNVGNNDERDHFYWSYLDDAATRSPRRRARDPSRRVSRSRSRRTRAPATSSTGVSTGARSTWARPSRRAGLLEVLGPGVAALRSGSDRFGGRL